MIAKILFIFICFSLFLNQAGRIDVGNNIAFTMLDISVVLFLLTNFIGKERWNFHVNKDTLTRPFLIFIGIALVSLVLNLRNYTWEQGIVAGLYLLRFVMYCLVYPVMQKKFKRNKQFVLICLSITTICMLLAGLLQYYFYSNLRNLYYLGWDNHLYRLFNTFFDPNFAGAFMVLIFLFFTTLFLQSLAKKDIKMTVCIGLSLTLTLFETFLTFSRSSLIMLFVSALVYLFFLRKIKYFLFLVIAIVVIYLLVAPKVSIENTNLLRTASSMARFTSEQTAFQIIAKNPLLGVGFDAYRYAQLHYGYRTITDIKNSHADSGTDNSFLFVFATTGIFGLLAFCFLQFKIIKTLYNEMQEKKILFSTLIIASFIGLYGNSLFINSLFYPSIILWMMIIMGIRDYR